EVIITCLGCVEELDGMANPAIPSFPRREVVSMRRKPRTRKPNRQRTKLGLPDLEHVKSAVLVSLRSPESQRSYRRSINDFVCWYCSESRLSLTVRPPPRPEPTVATFSGNR